MSTEQEVQGVPLNTEAVSEQISVALHPSSLMDTLEQTEDGLTYRVISVDTSLKAETSSHDDNLSPDMQCNSDYVEDQKRTLLHDGVYVLNSPGTQLFTPLSCISKPVAHNSRHTSSMRDLRVRDERKRASHKEVERRRRDKINTWIMKLGELIPDDGTQDKNVDSQGLRSKGGILAKACDYIVELRTMNKNIEKCMKANEQLASELEKLSKQNIELKYENGVLKSMLVENGFLLDPSVLKVEDPS